MSRDRSRRALLPGVDAHEDDLHFFSIGEFYAEIGEGLHRLHEEMGAALFCGDPARQVGPEYYYSGGGTIVEVTDAASAAAAMRLISEQGEGLGGGIFDKEGELAHYFQFQQLLLGRYYQPGDQAGSPTGPTLDVDWDAVYPIVDDADFPLYTEPGELQDAVLAFSAAYGDFLARLTEAFRGRPGTAAAGRRRHVPDQGARLPDHAQPDAGAGRGERGADLPRTRSRATRSDGTRCRRTRRCGGVLR